MFNFDKIDLQRVAVSSFGAVALTAACIGAAVAPARAATPVSTEAWTASVQDQIDTRNDPYSLAMVSGTKAETVIALRFTAQGDYAGAGIVRSSGNPELDAHAVKVAARIKYPALPESLQGRPQTVAMRLIFGRADTALQYADLTKDVPNDVKMAKASAGNSQIVAK